MYSIKKSLVVFFLISLQSYSQDATPMKRIDFTERLNLRDGQFAQIFIPDYFVSPNDGRFILVFHLHSSSKAAEEQIIKSNSNAILFNIHLGFLSSPYKEYFSNQTAFLDIIDKILITLDSLNIVENPEIRHLIITSFSAGYAGVREFLKNENYYKIIQAIILADGLHSDNDYYSAVHQLQDFLRFAGNAIAKDKILEITHSAISTEGYWSTTQTADYLMNSLEVKADKIQIADDIGSMYEIFQSGNLTIRRYYGNTAQDHIKHLYGIHMALRSVIDILELDSAVKH